MEKLKKILTPLALLLLLVGMPAVSWWYLSSGFEYRKAAIMTQGDFGKMPDLSTLTSVRGQLPANLRGSMVVVGWLDQAQPSVTAAYGNMLDSLHQQFENSPNLHFTTLVKADDAAAVANQFAEQHHLPEAEMLSFVEADQQQFAKAAKDFELPIRDLEQPGSLPIVALVDSSMTIVKHYNLANRDETVGLVELISVIIPLPARQDIVVDRAKEL